MLALLVGLLVGGEGTIDADVGLRVAAFARSQMGSPVGNGQCSALVQAALRAAGARQPREGQEWGEPVASVSDARPGDILQFTDTVFVTRSRLPGGGVLTRTYRSAQHMAVVVEVRRRKPRALVLVLHQNAGFDDTPEDQRMAVQPWLIDMRTIRSGKVQVFRPVAAGQEPAFPSVPERDAETPIQPQTESDR